MVREIKRRTGFVKRFNVTTETLDKYLSEINEARIHDELAWSKIEGHAEHFEYLDACMDLIEAIVKHPNVSQEALFDIVELRVFVNITAQAVKKLTYEPYIEQLVELMEENDLFLKKDEWNIVKRELDEKKDCRPSLRERIQMMHFVIPV